MTTYTLTQAWVEIANGEMLVQSKGPGTVYLYEGGAAAPVAPIGFNDAFTLADMREPRQFAAPLGGFWYAAIKDNGISTKLVVTEV